jgi:Cu-processing system ATP-binding protein
LRRQTELPSIIQAKTRPGRELSLDGAFSGISGLELKKTQDGISIACATEQKVAVLGVLASLPDTVADITIREPSLEDLFLGYGGAHARTH